MVEANQEIKKKILSWELGPLTRFQIERQGAGEAAWHNVRVPENGAVYIGWGTIKHLAEKKVGQGTITAIAVDGQPVRYCVDRGVEIRLGTPARIFFGQETITVAPRLEAA